MQLSAFTRVYDEATPIRYALWVGLGVALASASVNIRSISNDNIPNVLIPVSVLRDADLELSEFQTLIAGYKDKVCYWAVQSDRGTYSRYPIWTGLAAAPVFVPFAFNRTQPLLESSLLKTGRFAAVVACGFFAAAIAVTLRRYVGGWSAAMLTLFTVLGSTIQHQLGSNLSNQTLPLVCIAVLLWIVTRDDMSHAWGLCAGLVAGLAVASRLPAVFAAAAPLGVFLSRRDWRRHLVFVALGAAIFPMLTAGYQSVAFGSPFATGYGDEPGSGFNAPILMGLAGLLVSPTCGLFVYSPWLLFVVAAAWRAIRPAADGPRANPLAWWLMAGIVGQWILFSRWWAWNGALTFGGPRMLAETIPSMVVLVALAGPLNTAALSGKTFRRALFVVLACFSILHFLVGTVAYDAIAPHNPVKPDWNYSADIVALYIAKFGPAALALNALKQLAILGLTLLVGTWIIGRMLKPRVRQS